MPKRVMVIAGEASGDLHGSGVVRELKRLTPDVEVYGIGGDLMQKEGMELAYHISQTSFMGFVEVAKNLSFVRQMGRTLEKLLTSRRPDVVVLIDYPGFNLRFARTVKAHSIKVLYYISPQVWAWNKGRVRKMRGIIDRMKVVFPFEMDIYRKEGIPVEFVGHPLAESLGSLLTREQFFKQYALDPRKKVLALFPGSRTQEIERIFPVMAEATAKMQKSLDLHVMVGLAPHVDRVMMERSVPEGASFTFVANGTYDLMRNADAAIVTSGTATLETGWFGTPMVVVYKTSPLTYLIGRVLVEVKNIGLVNIVAGEEIVPELVQHDLTTKRLVETVSPLLADEELARHMRERLCVIRTRLGSPGASRRVAEGILELANAA